MNLGFDRLSLLETFIRIAERQSLSAAARDMAISQPSVSRQLAALEKLLGVVLIRRTTHSLTLTPDGVTLLADARRLLSEWEAIKERHTDDAELVGTIRVIAPIALGQKLLIKAAAEFMRDHPKVAIDLRLRDDAISFVEEGCDCWIKVGTVPDDTLVVRELANVERLVVATPKCISNLNDTALEALPWLTLGPFEGNRIELYDKRQKAFSFMVTPKLASDNIFAVYEATVEGLGIAIMPHWFVADELKNKKLINVEPKLRAASLPINMAIAPGTKRPVRVEEFCASLQNWFARQFSGSDSKPS